MAASRPDRERERDLLRQIDACIDRMMLKTPDEPYVLSIPQDEPKYHHYSHHSSQMWRTGTPFHSDDDPNQQYQTFYYHEPLSDVFQLHRNSHYQKDNASVTSQTKEKESSAQSTPSMLPKKKISLAAYANKKTQPDNKDDIKDNKLPSSKTVFASTSSQSLKSRDSANLPRMLSPLQFTVRDPSPPKQAPPPQQPPQSLLPPRLSPTLPPTIIASLDAKPYQPARRKHASKRLPSPRPPAPETARKQPPNIPKPETRDTPQEAESRSPRDSLIVKLKIPKGIRKNLCRVLQMKQQPHASLQTKPQSTIRVLRPDEPPAEPQVPVQASKRPRPAEEDTTLPDSKRKKAVKSESGTKQESNTPMSVTPAISKDTPGARNSTKDLRTSAAMKRVESTDSMVNGTPQSSRQVNGVTRPSPSSSSRSTVESNAWNTEAARIGTLGRDLKHAVTALDTQKPNGSNNAPRSRDMAAVMSLESLLLFMLSFYCRDRMFASRDPPLPLEGKTTWLTIPGFVKFVRDRCQHISILDGVVCHLSVVCNAMIILRLSERAMTPDETHQFHTAASGGLKASKEGNARLPLTAMMTTFPKTWKKAMNNNGSAAGAEEDVKLGRYAGDFTLPLGLDTEPLIAVRVGYALLREWCTSKELKYEFKFGL
ncbi:hypothetical protein D6D27_05645 [Aureobasidium pullulans]|nr:hypothetical protein D6D27_05645 [Aureobasidium pullulans]